MKDRLAEPHAESVVRRAFLAPVAQRGNRRAVAGGVLAGGRRLSLRRGRLLLLRADVAVRGEGAQQRVAISGRGAVLGADVMHKPSEAEELHRKRTQHHEEERQAEPPVLAAEVVIHRQPHVSAYVGHIHGHCGYDPQTVPHRVPLLLPAQAKTHRASPSATAAAAEPRLSVGKVTIPGAQRVGWAARVEPLHRTTMFRVLQRGEGHVALLHLQNPVRFSSHY